MNKKFLLALSSLVVLLAAGATNAQNAGIKSAPPFTANELMALPRDGWITNGGTLYHQRY